MQRRADLHGRHHCEVVGLTFEGEKGLTFEGGGGRGRGYVHDLEAGGTSGEVARFIDA